MKLNRTIFGNVNFESHSHSRVPIPEISLGIPIPAGMGMGTGKNRSRRTLAAPLRGADERLIAASVDFNEICLGEEA